MYLLQKSLASAEAAVYPRSAPATPQSFPSNMSADSCMDTSNQSQLPSSSSSFKAPELQQQQAPSAPAQPQIRHSGRAHIRGKIRRVWRPRYLELWDNGCVRYYELPANVVGVTDLSPSSLLDAYQQQQHHQHHRHHPGSTDDPFTTMIPKYTLQIFHARILDVTTLRDMHVGLPRGSFGFVFRGQRWSQDDVYADADVTHPISSSTHSYSSAVQQHTALAASPCQGGAELIVNAKDAAQRDYLCAVGSLEEAQMWVVALQWAASQQQKVIPNVFPVDPLGTAPGQASTSTSTPSLTKLRQVETRHDESSAWPNQEQSDLATGSAEKVAAASASNVDQVVPTSAVSSSSPIQQPQSFKMVITKVTHWRTVRMAGWWKFELAYEIHVLLLKSVSGGGNVKRQAETWVVLRTADELQVLVTDLSKELEDTTGSSTDRGLSGPVRQLPRFRNAPTLEQLASSLSVVDSILRSLVMDATTVNATAMKHFLGLHVYQSSPRQKSCANISSSLSPSLARRLWTPHDGETDLIVSHSFQTISEKTSTDQFVKQWLLQQNIKLQHPKEEEDVLDMYACSVLQRPLIVVGGFCIISTGVVALVPPLARMLWQHGMPVMHVRLDYLLFSWLGAAYVGSQQPQFFSFLSSSGRGNNGKPSVPGTTTTTTRANRTPEPKTVASPSHARPRAGSPTLSSTTATTSTIRGEDESLKRSATATKSAPTLLHVEESVPADASTNSSDGSEVLVEEVNRDVVAPTISSSDPNADVEESDGDDTGDHEDEDEEPLASQDFQNDSLLSSPLPKFPSNDGFSCWSQPSHDIFHVRGASYLKDRIKIPSGPAPLHCRGVDVWLSDNPERHIARHPAVLGGKLADEDTFLVNFLLPFGNFVAYFGIPPLNQFPKKLRTVWTKFLKGDQQYRDARLKLLPVVLEGPWIVKAAVGPGKSPALLGKVIPLQYFFRDPDRQSKGVYEVDVIITASTIAKGILSVVKGHTKAVSIAFAFIIEAAEQDELPETVLCCFAVHSLHLEDCPLLPDHNLDDDQQTD